MSELLYLIRRIRDTEGEIGRVQQLLAQNPDDDALELNILGLRKRQNNLVSQFEEETKRTLIDICEYRLLPATGDEYPISAISAVFGAFQDLVTIFLTAIKAGPRQRGMVPPDIAALATLDFAYSYQGSLGIALVIPNERLLFIDSDLDRAIDTAFKVVKAESTDEIAALAKQVGVAPIRRVYNWASAHARYGFTAEIKWKRGQEVRNQTIAYNEEMERLAGLIQATSEETRETLELSGRLTGLNVTARTFQLEPPDGEIIRGHLANTFVTDPAIPIPSFQRARLTKHTVIRYSVEEEDVNWELEAVHADAN